MTLIFKCIDCVGLLTQGRTQEPPYETYQKHTDVLHTVSRLGEVDIRVSE